MVGIASAGGPELQRADAAAACWPKDSTGIPPGSISRSRRRPSCLTTRLIRPPSSPVSPDWPTRTNVYPGFPTTQTLLQALRPYPQWNGIPPFLGPPDGNTWYDSLQIKGTQRFQHGLSAQVAYTWQKELTNGTNSNTSYVTPSPPLINDVFNKALDKQISGFSIPQELIIAFNYTTPRIHGDTTAMKALSWVARDWTIGGVLRYQSGLICRPRSRPTTCSRTWQRGPANNPALWGGGYTFMNRVPGSASVPGGSKLEVRSHHAAGAESDGVGGAAVWDVRGIRALLQRLPLAAAARRKFGIRANLLD